MATWKPGPSGEAQAPATAALWEGGAFGLPSHSIFPETGNQDFYMQLFGSKFNQKQNTVWVGATPPAA